MLWIDEVEAGLACRCYCPECKIPLVAKKGTVRVHHFAHAHDAETCITGFETALHLMAKQILSEAKVINFPNWIVREKENDIDGKEHIKEGSVYKQRNVIISKLAQESSIHGYIADLVAYVNNNPVVIEIAVTHYTEGEKLLEYKNNDIQCLEVNLANVSRRTSRSELEKILLNSVNRWKWLSHPHEQSVREKVRGELAREVKEANQRIQKQRSFQQDTETKRTFSQRRVFVTPKRPTPPKSDKPMNYKKRWFFCRVCKKTTSLSLEEFQENQNPSCKGCGQPLI